MLIRILSFFLNRNRTGSQIMHIKNVNFASDFGLSNIWSTLYLVCTLSTFLPHWFIRNEAKTFANYCM